MNLIFETPKPEGPETDPDIPLPPDEQPPSPIIDPPVDPEQAPIIDDDPKDRKQIV